MTKLSFAARLRELRRERKLKRKRQLEAAANGAVAPAGYHWEFVTVSSEVLTRRGVPLAVLVKD